MEKSSEAFARVSPKYKLARKAKEKVLGIAWVKRAGSIVASKKWMILLVSLAFLLGRAVILDTLMSFAVAYFAVIYVMRRDLSFLVALSLVAGSCFAIRPSPIWIALELIVVYLLFKGLQAYERITTSKVPVVVFSGVLLVQLFHIFIGNRVDWYSLTMVLVEAALAFVLTLVFIHAIPVITFTKKSAALKHEEIICVMILLACVMTGAVGWSIQDISVEHVLSRYMLLVFAMAGGAPLGATVGVVAGLIISLANFSAILQIGVLAFAGLLAGLLREGGKVGAAFGLLLGTSILTLYMGTNNEILSSTWESVLAGGLLMLTPRSLMRTISRYVPGSNENIKSQYDYAKHVRNVTADRVLQFSEVFKNLSNSFSQLNLRSLNQHEEVKVTKFIEAVAGESCTSCHRRMSCWGDKYEQTQKMMNEMMTRMEDRQAKAIVDVPRAWQAHCAKTDQVLKAMRHQYELYQVNWKWQKQLQESRGLVADQLLGVSQVMEDLSVEIKREGQTLHLQEEQIKEAVEGLGFSIQSIDIISLEEGNVEIEIKHTFDHGFDECRKIIAPLLSDILGEHIAVKSEMPLSEHGQIERVVFGSAKQYEVEIGVAGAAKGGDILSGDSFSLVELGSGKFAVAISDGMGNGERARQESSAALSILQQLLQSGMDEKVAVKSVNSILLLRSPEEMYATVDLAIVDLYTAHTTFLKIGSTPSFIKRGKEVIPVCANNLPIGIINDIDVDFVKMPLMAGDLLIMMSDGIYDAPGYAVNKELWMKRVISDLKTNDPQQIADALLETVIRFHEGEIIDDMTVLVTRLDRYVPEWASFKWPGLSKVERPKIVS